MYMILLCWWRQGAHLRLSIIFIGIIFVWWLFPGRFHWWGYGYGFVFRSYGYRGSGFSCLILLLFFLKKELLLILRNNNMPFWLLSNVYSFDFILLGLLHILKCKQSLLAHQFDLFVCPYFGTVAPFLLDFILQLQDFVLELNWYVFSLLSVFEEELSFNVKICLHNLLNLHLFLYTFDKELS